MDKLSFRKYRNMLLLRIAVFVIGTMGAIAAWSKASVILAPVLALVAFSMKTEIKALTYYRKRCEDITPVKGIIHNWKRSSYRSMWSAVIVEVNGNVYRTAYHFTAGEAQTMVGRNAEYVVLDGILFLYDIR